MRTKLARKLACTGSGWKVENHTTKILEKSSWLHGTNLPHWKLDGLDITKHKTEKYNYSKLKKCSAVLFLCFVLLFRSCNVQMNIREH